MRCAFKKKAGRRAGSEKAKVWRKWGQSEDGGQWKGVAEVGVAAEVSVLLHRKGMRSGEGREGEDVAEAVELHRK